MGRYTKQDVIDLVRENDVEFIRLQFLDLIRNNEERRDHRKTA